MYDAIEESFKRDVPSTFCAASRSGFNSAANEAAFENRAYSVVDPTRFSHQAVSIGMTLRTQVLFAHESFLAGHRVFA